MSADTHTEFHVHHDAPEIVGRRERLGVRLLIVADGAFLFGLIFSWFYLRNLNSDQAWMLNTKHSFSIASGWYSVIPMIAGGVLHKIGQRSGKSIGLLSAISFVLYIWGAYYVIHQIAHMPFIDHDSGNFESSYGSMWVIFAGSAVFHYILSAFMALGVSIRSVRAKVDPTLEKWRMATASSWFTWVAISGLASAITVSFK
jgi:heme/copper-type cytochrome/quinol oxidase subunit 3